MNVKNDAALHIMSTCSAAGDVGNVIWCITALTALHNATGCFRYAIQQNKTHAVQPHNHRGPLIHLVVIDSSIPNIPRIVVVGKKEQSRIFLRVPLYRSMFIEHQPGPVAQWSERQT